MTALQAEMLQVCTADFPPERVRPCRSVLLLAPYTPRGGGIGRMMTYLAAGAAPEGYRFEMVESRGGGSVWRSPWFAMRAAWRIARAGAGTILHVNMAEGGSVLRKGALLLFARQLGLSCVLHLHAADIISFYEKLPGPGRAFVKHVFRSADVCAVLGQPWRSWLVGTLGVPAARVEIIANGVPVPPVVAFPSSLKQATLVFLGNLQPRKGLADLIAALASEPLRHLPWELVVAGGGDQAPFQQQAQAAGLSARIRFTGWLSRADTTALLARASALVLPSYHEGMPLVLLEAASLGVPCITTPVGAVPEIFTHAETAMLVPPGNRGMLAITIARVIADQDLRVRLSRNARALFDRSLSIATFRRNLLRIYAQHCRAAA